MVARSDWGVGNIQQKGISHTLSRMQSSVGFHGPKTGGWIVFLNGAHRGEDIRIPIGESKLGSSWTNDIVLTGVGIGSFHATLRIGMEDGSLLPAAANRDIKINNSQITGPHQLHDGDLISFGDLHGIFRSSAQHAPGYIPPSYQKPTSMPLQTLPKITTCGWIIALRGPLMGQDFRLVNGVNRLGTRPGLEITIADPHLVEHACSIQCSPSKGSILINARQDRPIKVSGRIAENGVQLRDCDVLSLDHMELLVKCF